MLEMEATVVFVALKNEHGYSVVLESEKQMFELTNKNVKI